MVRKQPWIMGPLVPLSFVVAYQADLAYGNKMQRVLGLTYLHQSSTYYGYNLYILLQPVCVFF